MKCTALLCGLLLAAPVLAEPTTAVLTTADNVWDVTTTDLNGDGRDEILLFCCDETSTPLKKYLLCFASDAAGVIGTTPSFRLDLPPETGTLFFAEVDGAAPQELIAADAVGATVYRYTGGTLQAGATPRFHSLLPSGSREPLFLRNAVEDLDGDGIDEWLIPVSAGYVVRHADKEITTVRCDVASEIRRSENMVVTHRLPPYSSFALADEANRGLAFLSDEYADFAHGPNWSEHKRFKIPLNVEEKWESVAKMNDINNDGFPDLTVTQTRGTVNLESTSAIYLATAPFVYDETPSATFSSKGAVSSPTMKDVDGDGDLDAIVITISLGVKNLISYFVRGKISVDAGVYLFDDGGFGTKPDYESSLTLDAPEGRDQIAYKMDDFNGDGIMDLAFSRAADNFAIFAGETGSFLSSKPIAEFDVPSFGMVHTCDLNGNDMRDIVLIHPAGAQGKRVDIIQF